jgi:mono/diheme cytochrome c family protein
VRRGTALVLVLTLALAAAGVAGCGSDNSKQKAATAAAAARARARARQARLVAAGRPVFVKHCALCHTIAGHVAHPTFIESPIPNLDDVKPEARYVGERVETGGFDMPSLGGELDASEKAAVIAYVAEVSGRDVVATGGAETSLVAQGRAVFQEHCNRCHSIAGTRATNSPPATYPGTDFDKVKPSRQLVMHQVMRGIKEEMPSFRGKLTAAQIRAVAVYVNATAGS